MSPIHDYFKGLAILISVLLISSCATLPAKEEPQNKDMTWDSREAKLRGIENWDLKALIAIRTSKESNSASLDWKQNKQNYTLFLFGPLGSNSYVLKRQDNKIELETPSGKKFLANTPEELFKQQTGWNLPVSDLFYWVRGLPVPGVPAVKQFDAYHHLTELTQHGWKVHFLRYTATRYGDLPSKIFMDYPQLSVKIIISRWQF